MLQGKGITLLFKSYHVVHGMNTLKPYADIFLSWKGGGSVELFSSISYHLYWSEKSNMEVLKSSKIARTDSRSPFAWPGVSGIATGGAKGAVAPGYSVSVGYKWLEIGNMGRQQGSLLLATVSSPSMLHQESCWQQGTLAHMCKQQQQQRRWVLSPVLASLHAEAEG